jgi:hypothetical protein
MISGKRYPAGTGNASIRRTHSKLAHKAGCPIEEIQAALGRASIMVTERYLGLKQNLAKGPGDYIDLGLRAE